MRVETPAEFAGILAEMTRLWSNPDNDEKWEIANKCAKESNWNGVSIAEYLNGISKEIATKENNPEQRFIESGLTCPLVLQKIWNQAISLINDCRDIPFEDKPCTAFTLADYIYRYSTIYDLRMIAEKVAHEVTISPQYGYPAIYWGDVDILADVPFEEKRLNIVEQGQHDFISPELPEMNQ